MRVTGLTTNLPVADIEEARGFYTDYLGLSVEHMNLGWVARYMSGTTSTRPTRRRSGAATRSSIP